MLIKAPQCSSPALSLRLDASQRCQFAVSPHSRALQICIFFEVDAKTVTEAIYACALSLPDGPTQHSCSTELLAGKRPRTGLPDEISPEQCTAEVIERLQSDPDLAVAVLMAPCARPSSSGLSLPQLYDALPAALHADAARGFFGKTATTWTLSKLNEVAAMSAAMRTVQPLPSHVTHVRLIDLETGEELLRLFSAAAHLTSVCIVGCETSEDRSRNPGEWLRYTTPTLLTLQSIEMRRCNIRGDTLRELSSSLMRSNKLTELVLQGRTGARLEADNDGVGAIADALRQMPGLSCLGLPPIKLSVVSAKSLGSVLPGMPELRTLDLSCTGCMRWDTISDGLQLVECTGLTGLDLSGCGLGIHSGTCRALSGSRASLQTLLLDFNGGIGCVGAKELLAASMCLGLTCLSLARCGLQLPRDGGQVSWPWPELCTLTNLQVLLLQRNALGDNGAASLAAHIGALAQLRSLNIAACGITAAGALASEVFRLPRLERLSCGQQGPMTDPFVVPPEAKSRGVELVSADTLTATMPAADLIRQ